MSKYSILSFLFCAFCSLAKGQENPVKAESKINTVIVFLSGAQVQRSATAVDIPAGNSFVTFPALSPDIEQQSIQVKGEGNFTILSVNKQANFLEEQKANAERERLVAAITALTERSNQLTNQLDILTAEETMLSKNQVVGSTATGLDVAKLRLALEFHAARLTEVKASRLQLEKKQAEVHGELTKLTRQVSELNGKAKKNTADIVVHVNAKAATRGNFALTYLVKNASWYPSYDLRAKDVTSPIELVYKANITQRSGEEWRNVKLILSSGNPSVSGSRPELQPWILGLNNPAQRTITSVSGTIRDASTNSTLPGVSVVVENTSIGTTSNASGFYSLQLPSGAQSLRYSFIGYEILTLPVTSQRMDASLRADTYALNEVVTVGYSAADKAANVRIRGVASPTQSASQITLETAVTVAARETQTNLQFSIQEPYTVSSDGKQLAVDIAQYQVPALYEYYAAPKISPDAFLNAKITGIGEMNLLSGEASIFFEGAYLGKSLIDVSNSSDTLNISLGTDKNIVISRKKDKDYNDRQLIGSSQRATRSFTIDIKNRKSQAVNFVLEDQLPVSRSEGMSVEKQEISGAKLEEASGKLTWNFVLAPHEQKKLQLRYQVKYPKNSSVVIE